MEQILLWIFILILSTHFTYAGRFCHSVDIKHEKEFYKLRDCRVVVGHVRLTNFRLFDTHDIASPLEEITNYLLIYRVEGMETLEHIFPNLTIIRGHELLFDTYSLVVYENLNLRNLGLKSLLKITSGSIQIEFNPVLCFADTVNWIYLMDNQSQQHFSIKGNKDLNECALCPRNVTVFETEHLKTSCWNLNNFQRKKPIVHIKTCPEECGNNGCTKDYKCCSPLCLTGCFAEDCHICKDFKNVQGSCVETCNVPYYKLADQCITEKECRKRGLIPHAGSCVIDCPLGYSQDFVNAIGQCNLRCNKNFTIRSRDDLEAVKDCVIIRGSLHIELRDDKTDIIDQLERGLGGIKEISGFLKITKSPQIVTLGFFKKLDTIKGDELIDGEISFYVVDNFHLEEIWPDNHKVAILKGRIYFHLNPRLCYDKILQLGPSIRSYDEIRVRDASRNSNGERVVCGNRIRPLFPIIEDVNATAARVKIDPLSSSDKEPVLGYLHYYKEAPIKNVTMFDGRHGCGRDNWMMDMSLNRNVRHVFTGLKPYTQYAFFVKTFTMVDYHLKMDWYSAIHYFKTTQMKPGLVQKMYSTALSATALIVHWWPPKDPNGVIGKYLLRYEVVNHHINHSEISGYTSKNFRKDCDCGTPKNKSGPAPDDLNYYNRHQAVMDEAIPNFIFVSMETTRRRIEEERLEDSTRRKRETINTSKGNQNNVAPTDSTPKTNLSAEEQRKVDEDRATALLFKKHLEDLERKSLMEQDTGVADFPVEPPKPICSITNPSKKYQEEHNCVNLERYEGVEISGKTHSYLLGDLQSDVVYRISIRACVEGLENGCGAERSIEAETVSKTVEYFLKGP